jgi:hypothetical protein
MGIRRCSTLAFGGGMDAMSLPCEKLFPPVSPDPYLRTGRDLFLQALHHRLRIGRKQGLRRLRF